ncbi:WxcM-like domain-containing protein [Salmonella enterica subsp. enterica serovar Cotham]|nr:WxcM-like domain-containing protein [Salmonella enterica subsp. enterica serovar Cotham]
MDIKFIPLQTHGDDRGSLVALEEGHNIPFKIKRVYYIFDTKKGVHRGFHAHKNLKQVVIAVRGNCKFRLDNGTDIIDVLLDDPTKGLLIESFIWREMYDFSEDCVLMVLADSYYDEQDYIRNYDVFLNLTNN